MSFVRSFAFSAIALAALFAAMPASAQRWDDSDERLSRLESQVQALGRSGGGASGGSLGGPAAVQLSTRLDQLEAQVRELTGMAERNQFQNAQMKNQLERLSSDIELRFDQMRQTQAAAPAPQAPMADTPQASPQATPAPIAAPASNNPKVRDADAAPAAAGADAEATYNEAFSRLKAADYAGAERGFGAFLKSNPNHRLAGNAQYWLGETYYVRGQFKESAVAFAEGYQKYPKNNKAPDNLLKLGMSLGQLNSRDDACLTLGELKKNYPNAAPTVRSRADAERTRLGCKG